VALYRAREKRAEFSVHPPLYGVPVYRVGFAKKRESEYDVSILIVPSPVTICFNLRAYIPGRETRQPKTLTPLSRAVTAKIIYPTRS
jgi:hypothetical protein